MVFVNSMSDLFQIDVPESYITAVFEVMEIANWHTYQVLTKRSERMREVVGRVYSERAVPDHIWFGVSVEDQRYGLPRIDHLRQTPGAIRFLSIEPLLEDLGQFDLAGIDWVIVGGESGPGARPMRKEWVESILAQCQAAGALFFFKQWGGIQKSRTGRLLNGRTYDERPSRKPVETPRKPLRVSLAGELREPIERFTCASGLEIRQEPGRVPA
jgi:protein gp37